LDTTLATTACIQCPPTDHEKRKKTFKVTKIKVKNSLIKSFEDFKATQYYMV
jgi:hypothetical protein